MSDVIAKAPVRANKAPAKAKAAPLLATVPVANVPALRAELSEDDHCAIAVGNQISHLLLPIIDGPFAVDDIAGYEYIAEANDHAWDLNNVEAEWKGPGPAPTVAQLIPAVQTCLQRAVVEIVASTGKPTALMYCVRLLVAEALTISNSLLDAYKGLPGTHSALAALAEAQTFPTGISPKSIQAGGSSNGPTVAEPTATAALPRASEQTVALTAADLMEQAASLARDQNDDGHAVSLLELGQKSLARFAKGEEPDSLPRDVLLQAAAVCKGALALDGGTAGSQMQIQQLLASAFDLLHDSALSYDVQLHGCEEAASGIRAGQRQFRDRPTPPIRRLEEAENGRYNVQQLRSVLSAVAGVAVTLDQVLMNAQASEEGWNTAVLIDAAQALARHLGGMADSAVGGMVLGSHDRWNYGPNFADEGKAGAA